MFAFCRSTIGRLALTLGCLCAPAATSVQAQDLVPDAGAPDAATSDAATPDAGVVDASAPTEPNTQVVPDAVVPTEEPPVETAPVPPPVEAPPEVAFEDGADADTGIRGRIVDAKTGLGLEMAPVMIVDQVRTRTAITITNGAYELNVPPGVYVVRSFYDMHHGARLPSVRVTRGRFTEANLTLDPVDELEDIPVVEIEVPYRADTRTAAAQDELRRASSGIGEGMGAQQMSQTGASDAGSAAKRVVGVTVEGSNLVIRGLGGRYSRVFMNGVPLPSTDPDNPSVDLDLFPTNVIESMTVTKAFLPSMPADFAGGVLDIGTVTFPREFTLEVGLSGQYSSQSTLRRRLDYVGGGLDFIGVDDGTRSFPSAFPAERYQPNNDRDQSIARNFQNTWSYRRSTALPNLGIDVTLGNAIDLDFAGGSRLGYLVTASYDHSETRTTGSSSKHPGTADSDPNLRTRYPTVETGAEEVQLAGIGTVSLDVGSDHSFTALTMLIRSTSDQTGYRQGFDSAGDVGVPVEKWQLHYMARQVWFNQFLADHRNLGGTRMRLRWDGFFATALRDEPDRRNITYAPASTEDLRPRWVNQQAQRIFQNLSGIDGGGGTSLRFPLWPEGWGTVGGAGRHTAREFSTRRFQYRKGPDLEADDYLLSPEELFSDENLGSVTVLNREFTQPTDSFRARQTVGSAYAMLETPVVGPLSLTGGVRTEVYIQDLRTQSPFPQTDDSDPPETSDRTDVNVLPALSLKYEVSEKMLLRAAYGLTVGRPQARELASFLYFDFIRDRNIQGNPDLRTTKIHNLDLRWEWFFDEAQIIAVSLFYKDFSNTIEQYLATDGSTGQFANTPSAQSYGAEIEFRTSLKHLAPVLTNFEFGSNLTLANSRVELSPELTMATSPGPRQMFGQAPYVINLSLRFADPATRTSLGVVYNLVGPRLTDVGARASETLIFPNVERLPVHSLDLVGDWRVNEHLKLKLKWKNMLFQTERWDQGGVIVARTRPGTFVSLGADISY